MFPSAPDLGPRMPDARSAPDAQSDAPYADARDAFGRLAPGDQATFALEALFVASGALVQETGRHAARAIRDVERAFDEAFRAAPEREAAPDATPETPSP